MRRLARRHRLLRTLRVPVAASAAAMAMRCHHWRRRSRRAAADGASPVAASTSAISVAARRKQARSTTSPNEVPEAKVPPAITGAPSGANGEDTVTIPTAVDSGNSRGVGKLAAGEVTGSGMAGMGHHTALKGTRISAEDVAKRDGPPLHGGPYLQWSCTRVSPTW